MPQSLHSLLMAKKSAESSPINFARQIPGPQSPSHRQPNSEQPFSFSGLEEKELNGKSEMVYDDSLCSHDSTVATNAALTTDVDSLPESFRDQVIDSPAIRLKTSEAAVNNHTETDGMESENEILKMQTQLYLQKISLLENSLMDFSVMRDELNVRNAELYEMIFEKFISFSMRMPLK